MPLPLKRFWLVHEGRKGMTLHRFQTRRDIKVVAGLTVYEDLDGDHRDLLRFLEVEFEENDYMMVLAEPVMTEGEW